jgi:RecA-family ATPase
MSKKIKEEAAGPRRAGEFLVSEYDRFPPRAMFDTFWRAGELALMFGASGVGKSLLAVQLVSL